MTAPPAAAPAAPNPRPPAAAPPGGAAREALAERPRKPRGSRIPLLAYGFRPFFLGAALWAALAIPVWLAAFAGLGWPGAGEGGFAPLEWHRHAMLFGFVPAAIAGFLLTAVPNWVGRAGYAGAPLAVLAGLWLAGRLLLLPGMPAPGALAALVDVALLPALAATVAPALIRARLWRNLPFLLFLALLATANALVHLDALGVLPGAAGPAYRLGFGVVALMVGLIGGRIVPAFSLNALRRAGRPAEIAPAPRLEKLALLSLAAAPLLDLALPEGRAAGALAALVAGLHAARLARWHGARTLSEPIVWVLHLGYAWLPVSFALKAAWLLAGIGSGAAATHALGAGCFATMILAVMSRAALGHTGRALKAPPATVAAYLLVPAGAALRVLGPLLAPAHATALSLVAGLLWSGGFVLFLVDFAPILVRARPDGKPG